jgi:hypothetical protein
MYVAFSVSTTLTNVPWATTRPAKALELFLAMIIEESSKVTVDRGAKKVEVYHLYVPPFANSHSYSSA